MDLLFLKDIFKAISSVFKWANLAKKAKYWFIYYFTSPIKIVIFGESGTGKSQFISVMCGDNNKSTQRTRTTKSKHFVLPNGKRIKLYDMPGHKTYALQRKEFCEKKILKKKIKGIINVVSYGYHEADVIDEVKVFKSGTADVREEFLRENRNRELSQIVEWNAYNIQQHVSWIITVVNKADIWYQNRSEVISYYENGEYYDQIKNLSNCLALHTIEYCSIISPFCNKPMTIILGEQEKQKMHQDFLNELLSFIQKND